MIPLRSTVLLLGLTVPYERAAAQIDSTYPPSTQAWGSGGTFSFANALDDVASAIRFVRSDSSVTAFRIDSRRLILAGHSMGGWLALMGSAADSSIPCTVALDYWN